MSDLGAGLALPPSQISEVAFLGTPLAAVPSLKALVDAGFGVKVVVTQPDRRRGRGSKLIPSPVKAAALELGLRVEDDLGVLEETSVDLAVVVAYGRLIPSSLLERIPMVNVHFSLLPRWRGAAPVERAILAGDAATGVSIMAVAEGLDTGDVYSTRTVEIGSDRTAEDLTDELADLGAELLVETLRQGLLGADGQPLADPQVGEANYAAKLDRAERLLDFNLPSVELDRRVRIGRAWTSFRQSRLGVEKARPTPDFLTESEPGTLVEVRTDGVVVATSNGSLELLLVKPEGRRSQSVGDWVNGTRPEVGEQLGLELAGSRNKQS